MAHGISMKFDLWTFHKLLKKQKKFDFWLPNYHISTHICGD